MFNTNSFIKDTETNINLINNNISIINNIKINAIPNNLIIFINIILIAFNKDLLTHYKAINKTIN